MVKKLTVESSIPFNGLPELVAYNEGLFANEGIEVEFIAHPGDDALPSDKSVTDPDAVSSLMGHGSKNETSQAAMYNACEWGNYRRVQDTSVGARQVGRRAMMSAGAIIVPPWSDVYTPQQLANVLVGVPFFNGTHYLAIQMLEGFLPRELIKICQASGLAGHRYHSMMKGELDATTVIEPWIAVAEKNGCRVIVQSFYNGSQVATDAVDPDTYAAFNRAIREAVRRINADKRKYAQYFIDYHKDDPAVAALTVDDLNLSRILVVEPRPVPEDELQRTYDWMVSWGMIRGDFGAENLINAEVQRDAHELLEVSDND